MKEKLELYFMSLGLLFLLIFIRTIDIPIYLGSNWEFIGWKNLLSSNILSIICLFNLILVYYFRKRFLNSFKGSLDIPIKIINVKKTNYEYTSFLMTYIVPLVCFDFTQVRDCILLVFLLVILGILFIKTKLYYQNPVLAILGFNIYNADIEYKHKNIKDVIILTKETLHESDQVFKHDIENNELIYVTKNN